MDWKIIGLSALLNASLTLVLSLIFFPLFFIGPLAGGFAASYLSKGYEDYTKIDVKDGAVLGAMSGLIGGILIGLLFVTGLGFINNITGLISTETGTLTSNNIIITGYLIFQLSIITSLILGIIGGIIGAFFNRN
jgi:hypothetical protein